VETAAAEAAAGGAGGAPPLPVTRRRRRIVDLPLNATEDRVAGSVDIGRALTEGVKALEPGLLAEANRGILYVDEINLLDDHLTDILLDAAALGVNVVEREGVSIAHPARFLLVGTMNPEEGELRPQIADRIGLHVDVSAIGDRYVRGEILRRREAFTLDPDGFASTWAGEQQTLSTRLGDAVAHLRDVRVPDDLYPAIGALVTAAGVLSHRADVTILECAKAGAALAGRATVTIDDVVEAGAMALGHRLQSDPFGPPAVIETRDVRRLLESVLDAEVEAKKAAAPRTTAPTSPSTSSMPTDR
jgi:Mg-chelatase subunit ChlI